MANITAPRETSRKDGKVFCAPMAAVKVWQGGAVNANSAGYAKAGGPVAGERFLGVALETQDNSAGAAGDKCLPVSQDGVHRFGGAGFAITDVGKPVWFADDQTVQLAPTANFAGIIQEYIASTEVGVNIAPAVAYRQVRQHTAAIPKTSAGADYGVGLVANGRARVLAILTVVQVKPNYATSCVLEIFKRKSSDQTNKNLLSGANWDMQAAGVTAGAHATPALTATSADLDLVAGDQLYVKSTGTGAETTAGAGVAATFLVGEE